MAPLVGFLPTYVKDTNDALRIFDTFRFDGSDKNPRFLFTMDLKSLYTVIPSNGGLQALSHFFDQRAHKEPPTHTLTRLAEFVLTLNAFSFSGEYYHRAMESKMGPSYACLYVGCFEEQIRARYTGFVPQQLRRYIDDVVGRAQCSRHDLEQCINYVSNFHPALQFTSTISELELPFLDIKLSINGDKLQTSVHYEETDTHNYLHYSSLHPDHCKGAIPYSQFLRLRRICSDDTDSVNRATEMKEYFRARGYPDKLVNNDLKKVSTARSTLLTPTSHNESTSNKVPLVLTYNPFNVGPRRILLDNFNILSSDPEARRVFPEPPLVSYRRERHLGNILVHSADASPSPTDAGSLPCRRPRYQTCKHIASQTFLQGPKSAHNIRDHFTCQSENVVYCISCRRCNCLYTGETGGRLRERFSEHLRSIRNRSCGFPVAEHFNSTSHSLDDIMVCGLKQCSGSNISRKQHEMKLVFKLGTLRPNGRNVNFNFL